MAIGDRVHVCHGAFWLNLHFVVWSSFFILRNSNSLCLHSNRLVKWASFDLRLLLEDCNEESAGILLMRVDSNRAIKRKVSLRREHAFLQSCQAFLSVVSFVLNNILKAAPHSPSFVHNLPLLQPIVSLETREIILRFYDID